MLIPTAIVQDAAVASTFACLGDETLGSAQAEIDLAGLSTDYAHLLIECYVRRVSDTGDVFLRFNGDTASNYAWRDRYAMSGGTGETNDDVDSGIFAGTVAGSGDLANSFGVVSIRVPNYADASGKKACLWMAYHQGALSGNDSFIRHGGGFWNSTAAIEQVTLVCKTDSSNLDVGSRMTVYGMNALA